MALSPYLKNVPVAGLGCHLVALRSQVRTRRFKQLQIWLRANPR